MISQWRMRWVDRENDRRGNAYRAATDRWNYQDADLRSMRSSAASFNGDPTGGSLPVPLLPGERVYLTLPGVRAVEAPHVATIPPVTVAFPPPSAPTGPVPAGIAAGAEGTAVVTNRRLLFFGPGFAREWSYETLTGLMDDAGAPMTLMRVSGGVPSGVLIPTAAVKGFRFNLRLAIADAFGDRAGMIAQIDQFLAWHQQQKPLAPPRAEPQQAPARAFWSPLRLIVAGVVGVVLLLCIWGQFLPDSDSTAGARDAAKIGATDATNPTSPDAAVVTTAPLAAGPATTTIPAATVPATTAPATTAPVAPATTKTEPKPKPTTKATKKPKPKVDLCGAPSNPLGYTFCGGSHITSPDGDTCTYFDCIASFWDGKGYMEQCDDGTVSMSGGRSGSCSSHGGNRRPVYKA
jgi:hypothetical protein